MLLCKQWFAKIKLDGENMHDICWYYPQVRSTEIESSSLIYFLYHDEMSVHVSDEVIFFIMPFLVSSSWIVERSISFCSIHICNLFTFEPNTWVEWKQLQGLCTMTADFSQEIAISFHLQRFYWKNLN